jgi:hypothetical protein
MYLLSCGRCFLVLPVPGFNVDNVHETYLMKLPEDDPKCEPKHVAVIKYKHCKQFDLFIFIVVLTARIL